MTPAPSTLTSTARRAAAAEAEHEFDFACGAIKGLLRPDEVAEILAASRSFIYGLILEGRLEAHRSETSPRSHFRITRRSVVAYLASTAQYRPPEILDTLLQLASTLTPAQRQALVGHLSRR